MKYGMWFLISGWLVYRLQQIRETNGPALKQRM